MISFPPSPFFFFFPRELLNKYSERGKEFNPSAMFGIQGGREGKMGVKTFILQRVQWVQLPPCLRGENYASRFLTFSATSGGIREASPEAAPFLNSKV